MYYKAIFVFKIVRPLQFKEITLWAKIGFFHPLFMQRSR
ncbi:hypothetical protein BAZOLSSOX_947 [uncultured Gammaproteobacteria bacterium]|nr:hypothetical protein BAZOLSSOX_947 [uncultured Gammaproteobacteria bacterium]